MPCGGLRLAAGNGWHGAPPSAGAASSGPQNAQPEWHKETPMARQSERGMGLSTYRQRARVEIEIGTWGSLLTALLFSPPASSTSFTTDDVTWISMPRLSRGPWHHRASSLSALTCRTQPCAPGGHRAGCARALRRARRALRLRRGRSRGVIAPRPCQTTSSRCSTSTRLMKMHRPAAAPACAQVVSGDTRKQTALLLKAARTRSRSAE